MGERIDEVNKVVGLITYLRTTIGSKMIDALE